MRWEFIVGFMFGLFVAVGLLTGARRLPAGTVDFNQDVRPILSQNCFQCHGWDSSHRESGLRLDQRESATAVLENRSRAIVAGRPDASELIVRVTTADLDLRMPRRTLATR